MKKVCLKIGIVVVSIMIIIVGFLFVRAKTSKKTNPIATIQIEGYNQPIKIELDPQSAPNAVANFIKLANSEFYTNCKMTIDDNEISVDESMEKATLSNITEYPQNDYVYGIKGDSLYNGQENLILHNKGVILMETNMGNFTSYEDYFNSANCRFSILTSNASSTNGTSIAFGKVIEGMDVIDEISASNADKNKSESSEEQKSEDGGDKQETTITDGDKPEGNETTNNTTRVYRRKCNRE